jgi:phosphogluconate dehydratase
MPAGPECPPHFTKAGNLCHRHEKDASHDRRPQHCRRHRPDRRALQARAARPISDRVRQAASKGPHRSTLSCGNLAHGFAACGPTDKANLSADVVPNLGIITAYNDMLSAHQPFETYPELIRKAAREAGGVAQVAGGVPAMCDGVTQGQPGMELVAVLARCDRHGGGVGAVAQHVRRGRLSGRLRQDRAGPRDRGAELRPSAGVFMPAGPMTLGPAQ